MKGCGEGLRLFYLVAGIGDAVLLSGRQGVSCLLLSPRYEANISLRRIYIYVFFIFIYVYVVYIYMYICFLLPVPLNNALNIFPVTCFLFSVTLNNFSVLVNLFPNYLNNLDVCTIDFRFFL